MTNETQPERQNLSVLNTAISLASGALVGTGMANIPYSLYSILPAAIGLLGCSSYFITLEKHRKISDSSNEQAKKNFLLSALIGGATILYGNYLGKTNYQPSEVKTIAGEVPAIVVHAKKQDSRFVLNGTNYVPAAEVYNRELAKVQSDSQRLKSRLETKYLGEAQ